jgi:mannose-6-phosphate isomerase
MDDRKLGSLNMESNRRPWGEFVVLDERPGFKVKRITVNAGQRASLQSHRHRREHWTVVEGTLTVVVDGQGVTLETGQSIDIPFGAKHRPENPTNAPASFIEVQFGDYLGEDDIIRHEDDYGRA